MNALEEILAYPFAEALSLFGYPMCCPEVSHHVGGTYFRYWQEKNIARCHGATCSRGAWNIIDLVMHYEAVEFPEAVKAISDKLGLICDFRPGPKKVSRAPSIKTTLSTKAQYRQILCKLEKTPGPADDWREDKVRFAATLYFADEIILIANRFYKSDERAIPVESALISHAAGEISAVSLEDNERGAWVCINPVNGHQNVVEKVSGDRHVAFAKVSKSATDIPRYSYLLIESDTMSLDEQYSWLKASKLPILTLTHSGGKSLHAVVLIDASSEKQFKELSSRVYDALQGAGFAEDQGNFNANRYTRIPGVMRGENPQYMIDISGWEKFSNIQEWLKWMTLKEEVVREVELDAATLWESAKKVESAFDNLELDKSIRKYKEQLVAPFVDLASGEIVGCCLESRTSRVSVVGEESYYPCLYAGLNNRDLHICRSIKQAEELARVYREVCFYWAYEPECLEIWPVLKSAFERIFIHTGGDRDYISAALYFKFLTQEDHLEVVIYE